MNHCLFHTLMILKTAKAIVTGGASGLGFAVAQHLAQAGAKVAVLDLDTEGKERVTQGIKGALYFNTDVTSEAAVDDAMTEVARKFHGLTLAVNCAGILQSRRVLGRDGLLSTADFARVVQVNLIGVFTVCRAAANVMKQNEPTEGGERGVIINTASIAAFEGQVGQAAYAASKGGVVSLTLPLAREFSRFGIRVMAIAPGIFKTPMLRGFPTESRHFLAKLAPFPNRLGEPDEFANLVCHIYQNPMLNGAVIRLDGALRLPQK
jgi:NAD(P)-dependent dehydrogenase (short-subunit alcohol dehydrogenase family)